MTRVIILALILAPAAHAATCPPSHPIARAVIDMSRSIPGGVHGRELFCPREGPCGVSAVPGPGMAWDGARFVCLSREQEEEAMGR